MPKFLTYQRPAPISKHNWNGSPRQQPQLPRKAPAEPKLPATTVPPSLERLLKKE